MSILARFLGTVFAVLLAAYVVPGFVVTSFYTAVIVALVLGLLNITVKPILILFTLPITLLTFGLFTLVINAFLLWFVATFVAGFAVAGFAPAFFGGLIIAVVNWILHELT